MFTPNGETEMPDPATPVVDAPSNRPQQDPTALTTEKVQREIESAIDLINTRINGEIKNIETRLTAMDKALALTEKLPTTVDEKINASERVHAVELESINRVLEERYLRRKQWEDATVKAVETAFMAAKELLSEQQHAAERAIEKSEKSTSNSLGNLHALIADVKDNAQRQELTITNRINTIESKAIGAGSLWAIIVTGFVVTSIVIGIVVAVIGLVAST